VDPLAGALVALVILRTGIEILRESSADLMDTVPGKSLAQQITELLSTIPAVEHVEEIYAHRFGPYLVVNVTIGIDGSLSVAAGDEIASQVERTLYKHIEFLRRVHVHYHPTSIPRANGDSDAVPRIVTLRPGSGHALESRRQHEAAQ
jgi:divalent metal cation (Fe/Co/Zn/Cd) transporter